jgi:hypothetical protein
MKILRRKAMTVILSGILAGCISTSPSPRSAALSATRGDNVRLVLGDRRLVTGELIAAEDSSFVIFSDDHLSVVPSLAIRQIVFGFTVFETSTGAWPRADLPEIRRRARFPFGVPAEAMSALLRQTGQTEPDVVPVVAP